MRKLLSVLTVLVVVSMLFACSGGGGGGDDGNASSSAPVAVSFGVVSNDGYVAKASGITVDDGVNSGSFKYFYKAAHQWNSTNVTGDTNSTWKAFNNGSATIEKFQPGYWKFDVVVCTNGSTAQNQTVLYSGSKYTYINAANHSVVIPVTRKLNGGSTVSIKIAVPTVVAENDSLAVSYAGTDDDDIIWTKTTRDKKVVDGEVVDAENWTTFEVDLPLDSGIYTFFFGYPQAGNIKQAGEVHALNVFADASPSILGTMEPGNESTETISVTGADMFGIVFTAEPASVAIDSQQGATFTVGLKQGSVAANATSYKWYVGANTTPVATAANSFNFIPGTHGTGSGRHSITCVATSSDGSLIGYCQTIVTVTE